MSKKLFLQAILIGMLDGGQGNQSRLIKVGQGQESLISAFASVLTTNAGIWFLQGIFDIRLCLSLKPFGNNVSQVFCSRNQVPLYLWRNKHQRKPSKFLKYYDRDCISAYCSVLIPFKLAAQRRILNLVKHLVFWQSVLRYKPLTISTKHSILDVWQGFEYACAAHKTKEAVFFL